jgi:HEAT repeat protein
MVKDATKTRQRFPNIGNVSIAILENLVERLLGASAFEEVQRPYAQRQLADLLLAALAMAEEEFIIRCPDPEVASALLQLPIHELPSVQKAIWEFYERPNDNQFSQILNEQLKAIGSFGQPVIDTSVNLYVRLVKRECSNIDEAFRSKVQTLALLDMADSLARLDDLAKSTISERRTEPTNSDELGIIQDTTSRKLDISQSTAKHSHVFISYARNDRNYADDLAKRLQEAGYSIWLDTSNMDQNQDFTGEIEYAIKGASHFVVCLTKDVQRQDSFVRREIAYAINVHKKRISEDSTSGLPIIPLVFPEGELPVMISTWNAIFVNTDADINSAFPKLIKRLEENPKEASANTLIGNQNEIAVEYLEALQDFASAKLHDTVFSLMTLAASSVRDLPVTNPFTFSFSVSPAITSDKKTKSDTTVFSSFYDAFNYHGGKVFMVGEPGAGKTTTLLAFARDCAVTRLYNASEGIPIIKSIHTWKPGIDVSQWLFMDVEHFGHEFLASEKYIFILDGLDELGNRVTAYKHRVSENIVFDSAIVEEANKDQYEEVILDPRLILLKELSRIAQPHQLVISIRTNDFQEVKHGIALGIVHLESLDNEQIEKYFIELNLSKIWRKARSDRNLLQMFRTPLLLSLFTFAFLPVEGEPAPNIKNLTEHKILDLFIHRRFVHEQARSIRVPFDEATTRRYLCVLAAKMIVEWEIPSIIIMREDLPYLIEDEENADRFFWFCQRMHFFEKTASTETQFIHLKLRDYFAYFGLEITGKSGSLVRRETSVDILAHHPRKDALKSLTNLIRDDNVPYVKIKIIFLLLDLNKRVGIREAFELLGRETNLESLKKYTEALDDYQEPEILPALLRLSSTNNQLVFAWVAKKLKRFGDVALGKLIKLCSSRTNRFKEKTLKLIGKFTNDLAFTTVTSYLWQKDTSIRLAAIQSLVGFGSKATSHLIKLLSKEEPLAIRRAAIQALSVIQDPKSATHISRLLIDNEVRQQSLDALGHIPCSHSVKSLCMFLDKRNITDSEKVFALQALEKLWDPSAFPYLLKCFHESEKDIRVVCVSAMAVCHQLQDVPKLIEIYDQEVDRTVIEALAETIGRKSNLAFLRNFHDDLRSKRSEVRVKALFVIRQFRDSSSLSKLQLLLSNPPSHLSNEERKLLTQILDPQSTSFEEA